ncbi:hypothetical protein GCM10007377_15990 [Galliscardovia ingluviei]|uniref:Uncharacterized protein n=1 Tax=Galliscardovia ingluviei TaxID=1769422 RepID=A0A8J3F3C1_9BIFI|nr:hypothetical protein [Galliscardovia ingluviei]GGI15456.1 hypothetical protein GCM10007377_15990 [Galliscardovia ingluviei]
MNTIIANQVSTLTCTRVEDSDTFETTVPDLIDYMQFRATNSPDLIHDELYHYGGEMFKELTEQYRALYKKANADPVETPVLPAPYRQQQQQLEQQIIDKFTSLADEPITILCCLATVFEYRDPDEESWTGVLNNGHEIIIDILKMRVL